MKVSRVVKTGLALLVTMGVTSSLAFADSISPATYSATLAIGGTATISKTVTVTQQATAPVDVFFLADTTGSMGSTLASVSAGFSSIVTSLGGVAANIAFGVGEYKDTNDPFRYNERLDLSTNTASVQTALGGLTASGGGDLPEANLFGLQGAATGTTWRAGSDRYVVWVGDAPGHDPDGGVTEASAIAALNAVGATVLAASATSGPGLNAACGAATGEGGSCLAGQADRITAATGGAFLGTFSAASIVTQITNALVSGIGTYSSIGLQVVGLPAGVSVSFLPSAITGAFDRSIERLFNFDVTFTGLAAGTYDFAINALLDGKVIATEIDHIVVTDVPEPSSMALIALGLAAAGAVRRRKAMQAAL